MSLQDDFVSVADKLTGVLKDLEITLTGAATDIADLQSFLKQLLDAASTLSKVASDVKSSADDLADHLVSKQPEPEPAPEPVKEPDPAVAVTLVNADAAPVAAGTLPPGTRVISVDSSTTPVTLPANAVVAVAGSLPQNTLVSPVR